MPKIIKIGQCFTELLKNNTGTVFLRRGVVMSAVNSAVLGCLLVEDVSSPRRHFDGDVNGGGRVSQTEALPSESAFFGTFNYLYLVYFDTITEF